MTTTNPFVLIAIVSTAVGTMFVGDYSYAQSTSSSSHFWYENGVRHDLYVQSGMVADFSGASKTASGHGLQKLSGATLERSAGRTKIYRLNSQAQQKLGASGMGSLQSPVFSDSSAGGPLRALPGGVIVTFEVVHDESWIRSWAQENELEIVQVLPSVSKTVVALKSDAGWKSLDLANELRLLPDVASAEPNWWREKSTGPNFREVSSAKEAAALRATRQRAGRKFQDP